MTAALITSGLSSIAIVIKIQMIWWKSHMCIVYTQHSPQHRQTVTVSIHCRLSAVDTRTQFAYFFFINFVIVLRVICILRNQLYTHFASVCVYFPLLLSPLCFGRLLLRQFIGDYMISFVECIKRAIHLSKISRGDCKTSVSSTSAGRDANWGEWKYSSLKRSQKKWENIFVRNDAIAQLIRLMTWCGTDFYYLTMLLLRI